MMPEDIRHARREACNWIDAYERNGHASVYSRRNQQRFLKALERCKERLTKIKDRCTIRTGNCIDCNQGSHPSNECPGPAVLTDSDVSPWETTDEDTDSDMPDLEEGNGPDEETMEDWLWHNNRTQY